MGTKTVHTVSQKQRTIRENVSGYLFILPTVLFYTAFIGIPIFMTVFILSFSDFSLLSPLEFVGLTNFFKLFTDPDFKIVVFNTLKFICIIAPVHIILGLVLATLIDSVRSRFFQGFFRTVFYFPLVVTTASIVLVWGYLYDYNFGVFNWILSQFGIAPIRWLADTKWSLLSVALFSAWKFIGNAFLYYYIGLRNVPDVYLEAASIDGASKLQQFFHVKLPLLTPTLFFVITTTLINCFQMFDEPYFLTRGGPGVSSQTIAMHIYRKGFGEYHFGYASTLGLILFLIVLVVTIFMFAFQKKWVNYDSE
ncbi:carbohydrate ABC transporter permease [Treponema primitia]|uniref:carbohydrate ABC transporter permease n=1 Tax=Treponema primitia TaxID=88058 RepID=UPI0002555170|nr:sugar ABC transporter permease [Treponema primitia]